MLAVSPKVAFTYDATDEWGFFDPIAQTQPAPNLDEICSYDPPSFGGRSPAPLGETPVIDLDPDTARSVELGATYSTAHLVNAGDAFDAGVTAHYSLIEDPIQCAATWPPADTSARPVPAEPAATAAARSRGGGDGRVLAFLRRVEKVASAPRHRRGLARKV